MTKSKFNTMIEMLKQMDNDEKDKKSLSIKKPSSRNSSLTRQESKKEVIKTNTSKSSLNINSNSNNNTNPQDPRNLSSKSTIKKLNINSNNKPNSNSQNKNSVSSDNLNNSYDMVDEHVQTVNEFTTDIKRTALLETNIVELHNLCKTKDEIIKKLKKDIEKLNESNLIIQKRNQNLTIENEKLSEKKLNKNNSDSEQSLRIDRIDSNSNSVVSNSECNSIESNSKFASKLNRFKNINNSNNNSNQKSNNANVTDI